MTKPLDDQNNVLSRRTLLIGGVGAAIGAFAGPAARRHAEEEAKKRGQPLPQKPQPKNLEEQITQQLQTTGTDAAAGAAVALAIKVAVSRGSAHRRSVERNSGPYDYGDDDTRIYHRQIQLEEERRARDERER